MSNDVNDESHGEEALDWLAPFAEIVNAELDRLGYTTERRTAAVARSLGLGRTQAYRILNGMSRPSTESLRRLAMMGVSLDLALGGQAKPSPTYRTASLGGEKYSVDIRPSKSTATAALLAIPLSDGTFDLRKARKGEALPEGTYGVESLHFPQLPSVAVMDDDPDLLMTLAASLSTDFRAVPYPSGQAFLDAGNIETFDAILVDWLMPGISGDALIDAIRTHTQAPIFILTGDTGEARKSIIRSMSGRSRLTFIAKPAEMDMLIAQLNNVLVS